MKQPIPMWEEKYHSCGIHHPCCVYGKLIHINKDKMCSRRSLYICHGWINTNSVMGCIWVEEFAILCVFSLLHVPPSLQAWRIGKGVQFFLLSEVWLYVHRNIPLHLSTVRLCLVSRYFLQVVFLDFMNMSRAFPKPRGQLIIYFHSHKFFFWLSVSISITIHIC